MSVDNNDFLSESEAYALGQEANDQAGAKAEVVTGAEEGAGAVGTSGGKSYFQQGSDCVRGFFSGFTKQVFTGEASEYLKLSGGLSCKKVCEYNSSACIPVGVLINESAYQLLDSNISKFLGIEPSLDLSDREDFKKLQTYLDHIATLDDDKVEVFDKAYKEHGVEDSFRDLLIAESLAQVLTYLEKTGTDSICIPVEIDGRYQGVQYKISKDSFGGKLPLTTLKSDNPKAPSWILPRGTSPYVGLRKGAIQSLLADISTSGGLNDSSIDTNRDKLAEMIRGLKEGGRSLNVAGHSLGGALAIGLRIEFADEVDKMFAFGAPGISEKRYKQYKEKGGERLHMQTLNTTGDIVPKVGQCVVGSAHNLTTDEWHDPITYHIIPSLCKKHKIAKVDVDAENSSRFRRVSEGLRSLPARVQWCASCCKFW